MTEIEKAKVYEEETARLINDLAEIDKKQQGLKLEREKIEAELLKRAEEDLADTKYKSVIYSTPHARLTATMANTVKITTESYLPFVFGEAYNDMCKEKKQVELTAPAKRLIAGIWKGDYNRSTVDEVISAINTDDKTKKVISKKCKGINFEKDKQNLIAVGLTEQEASDFAYMMNEAQIWQQFKALLDINGIKDEAQIAALKTKITAAFLVEETPKIKLEVN